MFDMTAILQFGLRFGSFDFAPLDTVLLIVSLATALVSGTELLRLSSRDRLQQRVADLRGAVVSRTDAPRRPRLGWFDRLDRKSVV